MLKIYLDWENDRLVYCYRVARLRGVNILLYLLMPNAGESSWERSALGC